MVAKKRQVLTVKNIRNENVKNILRSVLKNHSTTRSILAEENNISLMTVKHVVDSLIHAGVLTEKDGACSEVGRKPKVLEFSEKYGNILCVNLNSRDEIRFLIYDIYESLLVEQRITLEDEVSYREEVRKAIKNIKACLREIATETVGIAVFVPGAYNEKMDLINYDLIPDFKELRLRALFEKEFGIKNIRILHDVFAAARSEYDSLNPRMESQFYFYCGYGVGGFFIYRDHNIAGAENMAGEVGKMLVSMNGDEEIYTTLEDVVSVAAVKKEMKKQGMHMDFEEMIASYQAGDHMAVRMLTPVLNTINKVLYNLLWVYNPTRIIVDSCKSSYSQVIAMQFQSFLKKMANDAIPIHVEVREAKYNEYHTMRGCFSMSRDAWIAEIADSIQ